MKENRSRLREITQKSGSHNDLAFCRSPKDLRRDERRGIPVTGETQAHT